MSSTNRSKVRHEHISDYYVTPQKPILDLFREMRNQIETEQLFFKRVFRNDVTFLDPCAGGDSENSMSYPEAIKIYFGCHINTVDIREDSLAAVHGNYLEMEITNKPTVIITNPPFLYAQEIIEKALQDVQDGGFVIMLLRLNFFGSQKREKFWEGNMPVLTFVHRKRINFVKGMRGDSIEYMHCVWKKGESQNFTKLIII